MPLTKEKETMVLVPLAFQINHFLYFELSQPHKSILFFDLMSLYFLPLSSSAFADGGDRSKGKKSMTKQNLSTPVMGLGL